MANGPKIFQMLLVEESYFVVDADAYRLQSVIRGIFAVSHCKRLLISEQNDSNIAGYISFQQFSTG